MPFNQTCNYRVPILEWLHYLFGDLKPFPGWRHGDWIITLDLEVFKKELGQVISGTSLKRFEGAFDWIPVLVTFNVDVGLYFNLFLNTANFGIEGVEEGYIEPDTVTMEVMNHRKTVYVHPGNVVRVGTVR